jgi:hypothetical protein
VLHGEKLWFLSPPPDKPVFHGDVTQMQVGGCTHGACTRPFAK